MFLIVREERGSNPADRHPEFSICHYAAFGGDAGDGGEFARLGELPRIAPRDALVHEPEIERRVRAQLEAGERAEERLVAAVPRYRHVDVLHPARDRARNAVGYFHTDPEIRGLHHVLVLRAAVAEAISEIDGVRHHVADVPSESRICPRRSPSWP